MSEPIIVPLTESQRAFFKTLVAQKEACQSQFTEADRQLSIASSAVAWGACESVDHSNWQIEVKQDSLVLTPPA